MLARAFLRFCALEALRPSALLAADGPWPTDAGKYVSDSRIDPIDDVDPEERRPIIGVFTEDTHLTKIAQAGPQFYKGEVDLVFEISVVTKFPVDGGDPIIDFADTDAKLEARLDRLEDQIHFCLNFGPTGGLFRQAAKLPFDDWESKPHRSGEEGVRLAKRTVRARVRMKEACYEGVPDAARANLDRLPPALKAIAVQLGNSSYLVDLALDIAQSVSVMPSRVDLNDVAMRVVKADSDPPVAEVSADIKL
jgi:hypothetical protein